ncbi:MAG: transcriptional regulator, partial [Kordiimonas sp.]
MGKLLGTESSPLFCQYGMVAKHKLRTNRSMTAYRVGEWIVRPELNQMIKGENEVTIEPRVLSLLSCFAARAGEVLDRDLLIEEAWDGIIVSESTINHTVGVLRRALGDKARDPKYIQTVAKKGYRLVASVEYLPEHGLPPTPPATDISKAPIKRKYISYIAGMTAALTLAIGIVSYSTHGPESSFRFTESKPLTSLQGMESAPEIDPTGEWLYFSYTTKNSQEADLYRQRL